MTADLSISSRYYRIVDTEEGPHGHVAETVTWKRSETALLMVDVYGLAFDDDPPAELQGIYAPDPDMRRIVREILPNVKSAARDAGLPVIYLTNALRPGLSEGNAWRNLSLRATGVDVLEEWQAPTPILEFSPIIAPDGDDVLIEKQFYSGFFETNLDGALRNRGIKNLVVVGFDSRICLGSTATDAMFRNYNVVVLRDCTRTFEFDETREGEWANFMAVRYFETQIGHTSTAAAFVEACQS